MGSFLRPSIRCARLSSRAAMHSTIASRDSSPAVGSVPDSGARAGQFSSINREAGVVRRRTDRKGIRIRTFVVGVDN